MSDDTRSDVRITGGCQCGAVRYTLAAEPSDLSICHCRMCQKASGGPFMAFGRVPDAAITWTRGAPATFRSSSMATRGFCAACGTPLTYKWRPDATSVTLGSLDDPALSTPVERNGIEGLLPWTEHTASMTTMTTDDWMPPEQKATFVNHQHPDHDT